MSSAYFGIPGFLLLLGLWLCTKLFLYIWRRGSQSTKLCGPPTTSRILGLSPDLMQSPDSSVSFEEWATRYGPAYEIPVEFGRKHIVITDPKAVIHFYNSERTVYVKTDSNRLFIGRIFGRGVLWAEGDMHKRQRKALTPAFSNAAIRRLTAVFYDSAYKLKSFWDTILESTPDGAIIEVQEWMNRIALDSVGIAGFSHDFKYLEGQQSPVTEAFEALQVDDMGWSTKLLFILSFTFPFLLSVPTPRMRTFWKLRSSLNVIAERMLANTRREKEDGEEFSDKSVIGLLLKAELLDAELHMTQEEVVAQVRLILTSLTDGTNQCSWALIELARNPEMQDKLRKDLARFGGADPTWDQLVSELPYLDATVHEVLRLHPPVTETLRQAAQDDVIPL
ncbi:cytochrome P450, partial [Mycena leptocephala]